MERGKKKERKKGEWGEGGMGREKKDFALAAENNSVRLWILTV